MGKDSGIAWTDNTHNEWIGCAPAGPGCDLCYARTWAMRFESENRWGPKAPRRLTSIATRNNIFKWQRQAERDGSHPRVFCHSLSDVFDNEVPDQWRNNPGAGDLGHLGLFDRLRQCPDLRPQLVTKRIGNVPDMLPSDWRENFSHCGIIATVCDQHEFDRDMPKLAKVKDLGTSWVGLSIEPQLGPIDPSGWEHVLDWIITGGESKQRDEHGVMQAGRPYHIEWAESLIEWAGAFEVAVFVKQVGSTPMREGKPILFIDAGAGSAISQWPESIQVQRFPNIENRIRLPSARLI